MNNLIGMIKGRVHFKYCRDNALWYSTDCGFIFPIPFDDIGTATFLNEDKGILFMRWIRPYRERVAKELANVGN